MPSEARRVAAELGEGIGAALRDFTLELSNELKIATPVDSGFARASWRPNSGAPGVESPEHPDRYGGNRAAAADLQRTFQRDKESAFRSNRKVEDKFLINNADYINRLNEGRSPQAAAGYVERVISDNTD